MKSVKDPTNFSKSDFSAISNCVSAIFKGFWQLFQEGNQDYELTPSQWTLPNSDGGEGSSGGNDHQLQRQVSRGQSACPLALGLPRRQPTVVQGGGGHMRHGGSGVVQMATNRHQDTREGYSTDEISKLPSWIFNGCSLDLIPILAVRPYTFPHVQNFKQDVQNLIHWSYIKLKHSFRLSSLVMILCRELNVG